jgi:hypothetical protein
MGCRTCFLPIFSEAAFFPDFFSYVRPSRELKSSGMESPAPEIPNNNVFFTAVQDIHLLLCVLSRLHGFMGVYNVKDILRWRLLVKRVFGSIEVALEASAAPSLLLHGIAGITLA